MENGGGSSHHSERIDASVLPDGWEDACECPILLYRFSDCLLEVLSIHKPFWGEGWGES